MKWYFVLLIVAGSIVVGVFFDKYVLTTKKKESETPEES